MAGDWIKMRGNLWDDPRVIRLCDITDQGEAPIVGGLYWLWAMADQHTEDGILPGLSLRQIDRKTGIPGFGQALCDIGWLTDHPEGVRIVRFEDHNGASAKRRCSDAQRKANSRTVSASDADNTRTDSGQKPDENGHRAELEKEKRREEKNREKTGGAEVVADDSGAKAPATPRATRLAADWQLPKAWGEWALSEFPAWTADTVREEAAKFADHWHASGGKGAAKLDWQATWRNWCRNARTIPAARASPPASTADQRAAKNAAAHELLFGRKAATPEVIDV